MLNTLKNCWKNHRDEIVRTLKGMSYTVSPWTPYKLDELIP